MPTSSSSSENELPLPLTHDCGSTPPPASPATFGGVTHESLPTHSSPVKRGQPIVGGRKQVEKSQIVSSLNEDADFLTNHLSSIPADFPWCDFIDKDKLKKVREHKPEGGEKSYYEPFSKLLTKLSQEIHDSLEEKVKATSTPIVFIPNSKQNLTYHPAGDDPHSKSNYAPDVVGVLGPLEDYERRKSGRNQSESQKYMAIPYPLVRTVIEMKTASEDGRAQAISYSWYVFEACPHIVGMYVLSVRPQYYQISWVDATGPVSSPRYPLDPDNLAPLASYLYSLYVPPKGHYLFDSTIQPYIPSCDNLTNALVHIKEGEKKPWLRWNVTVDSHVYKGCHLRVWSGGFGRRTTVFWTQPSSADEQGFVIKDLYRDEARRFTEQQMLELVHSDGVVPGVVRLMAYEEVKSFAHEGKGNTIRTAGTTMHQGKVASRVRTRLLLGSSGERLSRAKTLGDLLKAIYDTVEVHRIMVMERKILHRDVSVNNILLYPKHCCLPEGEDTRYFSPRRPLKFIDDVLASNASADHAGLTKSDTARCLIIDFDNSSPAHQDMIPGVQRLGQPDKGVHDLRFAAAQVLRERTGTPIFISRSVALGKTLDAIEEVLQFSAMPVLEGEAKERYITAYGAQAYERWCDDGTTTHGGKLSAGVTEGGPVQFTHKPSHDVESMYWTFVYSLLKAQPAGAPRETTLRSAVETVKSVFLQHTIRGSSHSQDDDERLVFLQYRETRVDRILHPMLQKRGLGSLLYQLGQQVLPEYAYLRPSPPVDHLHEAFRRILLNFIVDFDAHPDKDIALNPDMSRSLVEVSTDADGKPLGKRTHDDGWYVLPAFKRSRPYYDPEAEVNGSRVITESFRGSSAQRGSRSRS